MSEQASDEAESGSDRRHRDENRGQAAVVGFVLLVGISAVAIVALVVLTGTALDAGREDTSTEQAENAMESLGVQASAVAIGPETSQRIDLGGADGGRVRVKPDAGNVRVTIRNRTTDEIEQTVLNRSFGALVYPVGDTEIAYQGGGVWKTTESGSTMVSSPSFYHREGDAAYPTVTFPVILVNGTESAGKHVTVEDAGTEFLYPVQGNESASNPITKGKVNVTITSEYYEGWGEFLESNTGGTPAYDHENRTVTMTIVSPEAATTISQAVLQTGGDSDLTIGGAGDLSMADSYNSSVGPYSAQNGSNGSVVTGGNVEIQSNGKVKGNLRVGREIVVSAASANVTGNISYGTQRDIHRNAEIGGWVNDNASVDTPSPIYAYVRDKVDRLSNGTVNDNNDTLAIDNESLDFADGDDTDVIELDDGEYYLENLVIDQKRTLRLNTDDGEVVIGVENDVSLDDRANVTVNGSHKARIYVKDDVDMQTRSKVRVPGDRSPQFWLYGTPNTDVTFSGQDVRFVGAVYAPTGLDNDDGDVEVDSGAEVYGGIVGGETDIQVGAVHFDRALRGTRVIPEEDDVPRLTHLHVVVSHVQVTTD